MPVMKIIAHGDIKSFDLLVFGASIHAGSLEKEIVRFIERHAQQIAARERSFFLVLLSAAAEDPEMREKWLGEVREKFDGQLAVRFVDLEMVAGALAYTKYAFPVRWLMKRIAKQAGHSTDTSRDHEFTNWDQVTRYAQRLLREQAEPETETE